MIAIREIRPDEYGFLSEMLLAAVYVPEGKERPSPSIINEPHIAKYVVDFGKAGDHAFVIVEKGELVGAVWSRLFTADDPGYGFFNEKTPEFSIAIKDGFRNQGFGSRLIRILLERLAADGYETISLSVDRRSPARHLYQRAGFEIVSEVGSATTMLKHIAK